MGVSHAIGRKKRRIKDTFAARNLQPRKKSTDVIVEQRTSENGFKLELSRIIHAKKRGVYKVQRTLRGTSVQSGRKNKTGIF